MSMTIPQSRQCERSEVEHVRKFVAYATLRVNEAWIYPPVNGYRYMVALALYSKCLTVAEAILALVDAGFSDEAFGMTRTLLDIFFTLRYIANQDTDERARRYAQFAAKDADEWSEIAKKYWPQMTAVVDPHTKSIAAKYGSPHRWAGKTARDMAEEPDTVEVDPTTGQPAVHDFAYTVIYHWASTYVHPTIGALEHHLVQAGRDNFTVRSGWGRNMSHLSVFNTAVYVVNTMVCFYRCMGDPQHERLSTWADALRKHLTWRHK
jgi:hypothetical protein